jgi:Zn-dependent protease with chaperone function
MSSQAPLRKAGRSRKAGVKLIQKTGPNLVLASGVTITMLFGMVLALSLASVLILNSPDPIVGLSIALPITLIFNIAAFFLSPYLMDLTQNWLYHTRWVSLAEIESLSPETAKVIKKVCQQKKLSSPRLGIIDDQNPTAFT